MSSTPSAADSLLHPDSSPPRLVASPARKFTIQQRPNPSNGYTGLSQDFGTTPKAAFIDHVGSSRGLSPMRDEKPYEIPPVFWSTIWLRKITLVAFAGLFIAFAGALVGLWRSNHDQDGFRMTLSSNHYSWTYGPTALLVIVLSLWRQVDSYCKLTQPWQVLQRQQPALAKQSILLDYLSPLQITTLWWAIRDRHVPVAASVAGFGILKLVILVSTGLLVSTPTSISTTVSVPITSQFGLENVANQTFYDAVDDTPVQTYVGVVNGELDYPPGTLGDRAFQQIDFPQHLDINDLSVNLQSFAPRVSCEIAEVNTRKILEVGSVSVELDTPSCSVGQEDQGDLDLSGSQQGGRSRATGSLEPAFFTYYDLWRVNCSGPTELSWASPVDNNTRDDVRYALMVSNVSAWTNTTESGGTLTDQTAFDLSAVICDVDYSIEHLDMLHNLVSDGVEAEPGLSTESSGDALHFDGLSGVMLGEQIWTSLHAAKSIVFPDEDNEKHFGSIPLFYLMVQALEGEKSLERLLDPETLKASAESVWNGLGAQVARQAYEEPAALEATGQGFVEENKLRTGPVSLWIMVAGFILMAILSLTIAFTVHQKVVPYDPRTIASIAAITAASPSLWNVFKGTGSMRTSELTAKVRNYTFQTSSRTHFAVDATSVNGGVSPDIETKTGSWIPLAATYTMTGLMLICPLIVIVVLEILQRISDNNQGITDVTGSEDTAEYLSQYLSAFLMLLIATTFNNFDFTITSFAPYSILRSGNVPASRSTEFTLLGELAPMALFKSLRQLHLSSAFSNIGGIIGSVLTIVVSGLWTVDHYVSTSADVVASSANSWDTAWINSVINDSGAAATFDRIQHGGAILPAEIWEDLAFPTVVDVSDNSKVLTNSGSRNLTLTVEALRPVLACQVVPDDEVEIEFFTDSDEHEWLRLTALPQLPSNCQRGGANGTDSYTNFSRLVEYYDFNFDTWVGNLYDLHMGPWDDNDNSTGRFGEASPPNPDQPDNPQGCPSVGIIFAAAKGNTTTHDDVSALICSQKVQSVEVFASYDGDSSRTPILQKDPPPVPDESTARFLTNGTDGLDAFPYRIQGHLRDNLTTFPSGVSTDDFGAPVFFNHLLYGPDNEDADDLLGAANRDALMDALNRLYARYMVHVVDLHFRQDRSALASESTSGDNSEVEPAEVTGTAETRTSRLRVNRASKIALQAMLAAMALLGAGAFALSDLRGTLPRGPCSIASVVGFVAGSELVERGGGKHERSGESGGWLYAVGWWPAGGNGGRDDNMGWQGMRGWEGAGLASPERMGERRFGVDVGVPEELGFRQTGWWEMRRRIKARGASG